MADLFTIESNALPPETRVAAWRGRQRLSATYEYELWLLVPDAAAVELDPDAVVLKPGVAKSDDEKAKLIQYLRDSVAPYKVPRVVEFMDELPTSGVGKILKREIKKMLTNR